MNRFIVYTNTIYTAFHPYGKRQGNKIEERREAYGCTISIKSHLATVIITEILAKISGC